MTPAQFNLAKELFVELQSVPVPERPAWIDSAAQDNPEVRCQLLALIEADAGSGGLLDSSPLTQVRTALEMYLGAAPTHIGPFRIRRELGRGGMGVVYLASRSDGSFEKDVAIKLVRAGFDAEMVRRFQSERQILADLDHPNIARLLDGGTTGGGFPYLVMEYVDGEPLLSYCAERLQLSDRLGLFQAICAAVEHAHNHGVLHRDLKPANILVTRTGVPKLLDFGIAKVFLHSQNTAATGFHPLTPDYASPEQRRGEPLTPASDCYSLGVILYQLLTGMRPSTPFPQRPSTQISGPCETAALRGNLDNIALKALDPEPQRRYASAASLSGDIQRHLEGFPVSASGNPFGYRTCAFLRRNRRLVSVAALAILALGGAVLAERNATAAREAAERRYDQAARFGVALLRSAYKNGKRQIGRARPSEAGPHADFVWAYGYKGVPRGGSVQTDFPSALLMLEPRSASNPTDTESLRSLALTYEREAYYAANVNVAASVEASRRWVQAAERLARLRPFRPAQIYYATSLRALGERLGHPDHSNSGDTAAARHYLDRAVELAEQWVPKLPEREGAWYLGYCYASLAGVLWAQGDADAAISFQERAITHFENTPRDLPDWLEIEAELAMVHVGMAKFLHHAGRQEAAFHSIETAIAMLKKVSREDAANPLLGLYFVNAFNQAAKLQPAPERALAYYRRAEEIALAKLENDPQEFQERLAEVRSGMAQALARSGDLASAEQESRESVRLAVSLMDLDATNVRYRFTVAIARRNRGELLEKSSAGRAAEEYREALKLIEALSASDSGNWLKRQALGDVQSRLRDAGQRQFVKPF